MIDTITDLVPLADALLLHPDEEPCPGSMVVVDGEEERLQAVLERTVVVGPEVVIDGQGRYLVPIGDVSIG